MKVHEYQAKELLEKAGVAVPKGIVVTTPAEAAKAYDALGGGLIVVKAQVHAGGRGKGVAVGPEVDRDLALAIASGKKPRPDGMAKGVQLVKSAAEAKSAPRACWARRWSPTRPARGAGDLEGAGDGRPQHRPRALPWPGDRPQPQVPGAHGLDRGRRRDRDGRRQDAREDPSRADRRRSRPGRFPGPQGLQGPRAHRSDGQEGRDVPQELRQAVPRHGRLAGRDQPADRHRERRRAGTRLQAQLRRQCRLPPSRRRGHARRDRGRSGRASRLAQRALATSASTAISPAWSTGPGWR